MSRSKRKAYNQGRRDGQQIGYFEGYAKGLHDGNPFNKIIEAVSNLAKTIADNPELMAEALKARYDTDDGSIDVEDES